MSTPLMPRHEVLLTGAEIQRILPHRYPFLLVDSVTVLEPDRTAVGTKTITTADIRGGWRSPTLVLEMMAQVGAVLVLCGEGATGAIPYFAGIDHASFTAAVRPGDVLAATVVLRRRRGHIGWGEGRVTAGDALVCKASFTYAIDR